MKVILLGTPEFAVPSFEAVINHFEVVALVCQPDAKAHRGQKPVVPPVKHLGLKYHLPVLQPEKISQIYDTLKTLDCDVLLTCAFGQFIPPKVLQLAKRAALNIHGSLLPRWRGAAPIHYALLNGDEETGVSLMYMVKEMDAGDVLFQARTPILPTDDFPQLYAKLARLSQEHIVAWLRRVEANDFRAVPQDASLVTWAPKITKEFYEIKPSDSQALALCKVRVFKDVASVFVVINHVRYKVFEAFGQPQTGSVEFAVQDGAIYITELQPSNKKRMRVTEFLRGNHF